MRHDEADEADAARDGDRDRRRCGGEHVQRQRDDAHVDAERGGASRRRARAASRRARTAARRRAPRRARASARSPCADTDRSPISQNSMPRTCVSGATDSISMMSAPKPAATTTPVRSNRVGDHAPRPRARPNTSNVDSCRARESGGRGERREAEQQRRERAAGGASGQAEHVTDPRADCATAPASARPRPRASRRPRMRRSRAAGAARARPRPRRRRRRRPARATTFGSAMSTLPTASATATEAIAAAASAADDTGQGCKEVQGGRIIGRTYFPDEQGIHPRNRRRGRRRRARERAAAARGHAQLHDARRLRAAQGRARPSRRRERPAARRHHRRGRPATATARRTATTSTARSACAKSIGASASWCERLDRAEVVDPSARAGDDDEDRVYFGATVDVVNAKGEPRTVSIVGVDEIDTARGYISWVSPMARALIKAREGDTVTLQTPGGAEELEIAAVRYVPLGTGPASRRRTRS